MISKRIFDVVASLIGLLALWPLLAITAIAIRLESTGAPFFVQERVGRHGRRFRLVKLRTMRLPRPDETRQITVGADPRITHLGRFLRKTKIDELPQLLNVLKGDMSIVGPRPEVPAYMERYTPAQQAIILSVRPGITDFAAIEFCDEAETLARAANPEEAYVKEIMPRKFELYARYIEEQSLILDLKLILGTLARIIRR